MSYRQYIKEKLSTEDEIRRAFTLAKEYNVVELPVFEKEKYVGVIDIRPLISFSGKIVEGKVGHFTISYPIVYEDENEEININEAVKYMVTQNIRGVPLFKANEFDSMIYDSNVLKYLYDKGYGKNMSVDSLATKSVVTIAPGDTLSKALAVIRKHNISRLLVMDGRNLVGIITRTQIIHLLSSLTKQRPEKGEYVPEKFSIFKYPVKEVMESPVITVQSGTTVYNAIKVMINHNIRGVPVIDNKKNVLGIITSTDVIKSYFLTLEEKLKEQEFTYELHIDDDEVRSFVERLLQHKRFPEKSHIKIIIKKPNKNIYDISAKVILVNGHTLVYRDSARGRIEAFRRVKKMITTLYRECYEEY